MSKPIIYQLRYSNAYRIILGLANFTLLAIVVFLCIRLYSTIPGLESTFAILIALLVFSLFLCYELIRYSHYVFKWYASLSDEGVCIFDPKRGRLDYYWDTDTILMDSFNLRLVKGAFGAPARMSRSYEGYKISKWLQGHKQIIDSLIAFVSQRSFMNLKLSEIAKGQLMEESRKVYYRFLNNNKWNMLYLGFHFSRITTVLLVLYIFVFDIFYFNPEIALSICIIVGIQLTITFQYWNLLPFKSGLKQMINCIVAIIAFFYIMFDNVHFKNEIFFILWGVVFGCFLTMGIFLFVYFYISPILTLGRKITGGIFFPCFLLLSLYSTAFLKVGNIAFSEQPFVWEKGTAHVPVLKIILLGTDSDYVDFDDKDWGSHFMGLFFLSWTDIKSDTQPVELLTYKGRLGIPWMYKNYPRDEKVKAKAIVSSE